MKRCAENARGRQLKQHKLPFASTDQPRNANYADEDSDYSKQKEESVASESDNDIEQEDDIGNEAPVNPNEHVKNPAKRPLCHTEAQMNSCMVSKRCNMHSVFKHLQSKGRNFVYD